MEVRFLPGQPLKGEPTVCQVCKNQKAGIAFNIPPWRGYEAATHVVIAFDCLTGGVMATATNELEAHRYAKVYRDYGYQGVAVRKECDKTYEELAEQLADFMLFGAKE